MRVRIAYGIFGWEGGERRSRRYGAIHFDASLVDESDAIVKVYHNKKALKQLRGKRVRLIGKVLDTRESGHVGDLKHGIRPSTPEKDEEIDLGVGTLDIEPGYDETPDVVLRPNDGRQVFWIDPRKLYRLHEQTVDLFAEETEDAFAPAPDIKSSNDLDVRDTGDGYFQVTNAEPCEIQIDPQFETLGDGLFAVSAPQPDVNGQFKARKIGELDENIQLTDDENKLFTVFSAAACDLRRASDHNTHQPCWLCMSDEARAEIREDLRFKLQFAPDLGGKLGMSMADAEKLVEAMMTPEQREETLQRWREIELQLKRRRAGNDPHAFFA